MLLSFVKGIKSIISPSLVIFFRFLPENGINFSVCFKYKLHLSSKVIQKNQKIIFNEDELANWVITNNNSSCLRFFSNFKMTSCCQLQVSRGAEFGCLFHPLSPHLGALGTLIHFHRDLPFLISLLPI